MIRELFNIGGSFVALITLPGSIELLVLTVAGILPNRRTTYSKTAGAYRLAVVIPAHNEELHVARCVKSLWAANQSAIDVDIIVIADNCTDLTASAARHAGARVLVRTDPLKRGKGYALDFAFQALALEGWDAIAVVDADSEVAANFLTEISAPLIGGADAVQCRYVVGNADESMRTRLIKVANGAFNVLRPRGRERCGLSAGIYGNGFALASETLSAVPYTAASLVEDLEYHLALVNAGKRVRFVDSTSVYGDIPVTKGGMKTQRARWEGGRLRMLREKTPQLIGRILRGRGAFVEPCLDLLLLPLVFHTCLLLIAAATPFWPVRAVAVAGLFIVFLHLIAAIAAVSGGWKDVATLFTVPLYVVWKILLIPRLARSTRATTAWTRTERVAQRNIP